MPDSLQAAMAAQIDVLEPTERRILRTAAVLGRSFRREVLRETLSADGLTRDPGKLTQLSDFLEADGPDRLALPQQPGARRRVRGAGLPDARETASCCRPRDGAAQRRPGVGRADAVAALLARRRRRARRGRTASWPATSARRAYANADAAAQYELALDAAKRTRRPDCRARSTRGPSWASFASWPAMLDASIAAYRRAADLADGRSGRCTPTCWCAERASTTGPGRTATAPAGRSRRRGDCWSRSTAPTPSAPERASTTVTAFIRLGQERLKERPGERHPGRGRVPCRR